MRLVSLLLALAFLLFGMVFGALNSDPVILDFYRFQQQAPLGVALLGFAVVGAILAGLMLWLGVIWPQRRRIRRLARREMASPEPTTETSLPSAFPEVP